MRTIYVPALLTGIENVAKRCLLDGNRFGLYRGKYDPTWFSDLSMIFHPQVLVSYYYSQKLKDYRKLLRIRDDVELWTDSGGYSVITHGFGINPQEVLSWQEKNADIAFSLDYPPAIAEGVGRVNPGKVTYVALPKFEEAAEKSHQNNVLFEKYRNSDKLKIYNIMHGYNRETLQLWWDYVHDAKFEGYATGAKPQSDILLQSMCTMFLYSKGVRERVHLLGVSGITVIPALVWMSQYIDKISFDSSSYGYGSRTRAYVYPERIRDYTHFGKKYVTKLKSMTKLYCKCPICKDIKTIDYFLENEVTWPGILLSLHNLWAVKDYTEKLEEMLYTNKEGFFPLVKQHVGNNYDKVIYAINFIEECIKNGFDYAYNIYFRNHMNYSTKTARRKLL